MDFILLLLTRNPERNGNLAFRVLFCLSYGNFFQQNSKNRIRGTDAVFSKGIFMKKFLRKDTYIIGCGGEFVKHFFYNSHIIYNYASSADSNTCTSTL